MDLGRKEKKDAETSGGDIPKDTSKENPFRKTTEFNNSEKILEFDLRYEKDMEKFVGIKIYSTTTPGIGGVIKKRPSDFIVCEVLPNGVVLNIDEPTFELENDQIEPLETMLWRTSLFLNKGKKVKMPIRVKYTTFTLVKKREDTILAAEKIAKALNINNWEISWAGLKDNNAITAQRMSVRGNYIEKLMTLTFPNIFIKDISYSNKPIRIGRLWGNKFIIYIRDLENTNNIRNILKENVETLSHYGFPNFYGLQRFGNYRPNSHIIGKYLFMKDYKKAVEEFLFKSYPKENEDAREFRKELAESQDFTHALNNCPKGLKYEWRMIRFLSENPEKYKKAFNVLPPPLINLILSSYQSYLFNLVVSERKIREGNLITPKRGDVIAILFEEDGLHSNVFYKFGSYYDDALIKALDKHRATIMAPVLGYESDLKSNYFSEIYKEILEKENFDINCMKSKMFSKFIFRGTYRPIFIRPKDLTVKYFKKSASEGPSVRLEFKLPKGSYATMMLREFIK
ncbi:MAG: tRNA pseudouridine(13) synthase TruD [Promethearchaeota archaeon]